MNIRGALPSEHELLSQLAYASKGHWGYTAEQLDLWKSDLAFTPKVISAWPTFVAEDERRALMGVVQLNPTAQPWELDALWVHPSAVGRGVGRTLLRHALQVARQAGQGEVAIDADPNAEGFYLSCGAKRIGERAAPISRQPHRIRPQLRLPTSEA